MIITFKICMLIVACLFYILAMGSKTERMFIGYTAAATVVSLVLLISLKLL